MQLTTYLKLSDLATHIRDTIDDAFAHTTFWVLADLIDHKRDERKGHHYFCLVEKDIATHSVVAKMSAAAWRSVGAKSIAAFEAKTGQIFSNNIQVLVNVSVEYSPAYGLKLILNEVDPFYTLGLLEQARRDTLLRLITQCPDYIRLEGDRYVTRNNSLSHARVIQRVAVLTSGAAAGYQDFKATIGENRHGYQITLDTWFTTVQGEANAAAVCQRLIDIYKSGVAYDAVVIIRGGGSQSDLLLFDQFVLARAVAKFPIPVITGIGHQINQSIVDLMAHTPVKTPSMAAEAILAHNRHFEESIVAMQQRVVFRAGEQVQARQEALTALRNAVIYSSVAAVGEARAGLSAQQNGLIYSGRMLLERQNSSLARHAAITRIMNPVNILKRGFAVVYRGNDLLKGGEAIGPADDIRVRFHDVTVGAIVTSKTPFDGTGPYL